MRIHVAYLNCQDKFNFIANFYMCGIRESRSSNWSTGTPSLGNTFVVPSLCNLLLQKFPFLFLSSPEPKAQGEVL